MSLTGVGHQRQGRIRHEKEPPDGPAWVSLYRFAESGYRKAFPDRFLIEEKRGSDETRFCYEERGRVDLSDGGENNNNGLVSKYRKMTARREGKKAAVFTYEIEGKGRSR